MKNDLKIELITGKCELCGHEGKVYRFSRPIEGYEGGLKDKGFTFKRRSVQEVCETCLVESIAKGVVSMSESGRKNFLKLLQKHGYKVTRRIEN